MLDPDAVAPSSIDAFRNAPPRKGQPSALPRMAPEDFHRGWWAATPEAVSVRWISTFTCSGRGSHKAKSLADVAAILMRSGLLEFELRLPTDKHGRSYVHLAGQGLANATRFLCPACNLDKRINERTLTESLRRLGDNAPRSIDVSLIP